MTVLIQDGRRGGHLSWATQAVTANVAGGVIISPFHTPRVAVPRHRSGADVVAAVRGVGGEAFFDPTSHAALLSTSDDLIHYNTWQLWGPSGMGLDTDSRRLEHLERVFLRQQEIGAAPLAPTLTLDSPLGQPAGDAFRTSQLARGLVRNTAQALAGRRSFWRGGPDLDAYVGSLASLRAPTWLITVVNDSVADNVPDLTDTDAFVGLLRTVHSLSQRSRVVICHADFAGIPAVAAGASAVGAGWDRGMRFFDPKTFQVKAPGIAIPASYVTQGGLGAVLRRDTGDAFTRLLGDAAAGALRGGPMPVDDAGERTHHLRQLSDLVHRVDAHGLNRAQRVDALRTFYTQAATEFNALLLRVPRGTLQEESRRRWVDYPHAALEAYARAEGL